MWPGDSASSCCSKFRFFGMFRSCPILESRSFGAEEARECHSKLRLGAPCRLDQFSPKSVQRDPASERCELGASICASEIPKQPMRAPRVNRTVKLEIFLLVFLRKTPVSGFLANSDGQQGGTSRKCSACARPRNIPSGSWCEPRRATARRHAAFSASLRSPRQRFLRAAPCALAVVLSARSCGFAHPSAAPAAQGTRRDAAGHRKGSSVSRPRGHSSSLQRWRPCPCARAGGTSHLTFLHLPAANFDRIRSTWATWVASGGLPGSASRAWPRSPTLQPDL